MFARGHGVAASSIGLLLATLLLAASSPAARADAPLLAPLAGPAAEPPAPWKVYKLPRQTKPVTTFAVTTIDGQRTLRIEANESYGTLGHLMRADAPQGHTLAWRWRIDQPIPKANLRERSGDDTAVKICALYDMPDDKIPALDRVWLQAARVASDSDMPSASVCYVWDSRLPVGTVLPNAFSGRIRYIVLRSSESPPATWMQEKRNLDADFLRLFGDEVNTVPRLTAVVIGGDSDNTRSHSLAYVADLELSP